MVLGDRSKKLNLRDIFEHFKVLIGEQGWRSPKEEWLIPREEWVIEGAGELVFYSLREYSNTVPTHVVERDLDILMSQIRRKKDAKAYGMIALSPCTNYPC